MKTIVSNKKILPMKYPIINSYPCHADIISVISNSNEYLPWLFNNYIQLNYPKEVYKDGPRLDFYVSYLWEACPYIFHQHLCKEFIALKWENITHFLFDSINLGFYIHLIIDTFYIPCYAGFNERHNPHDIFIYGYDEKKKHF